MDNNKQPLTAAIKMKFLCRVGELDASLLANMDRADIPCGAFAEHRRSVADDFVREGLIIADQKKELFETHW